jgi:hypothetical protein
MAYTNNNGVDEAVPNGASAAASSIDTIIQDVKKSVNERMLDLFGVTFSSSTEQLISKLSGAVTFNGTAKQANQAVTALGNITGAVALDFDVRGNYLTATLTGNVTFSVSNLRVGTTYVLFLAQDATGTRTITWPAGVRWPGGTAPTFNTTASRASVVTLTPYSGSIALGSLAGTNYNVS